MNTTSQTSSPIHTVAIPIFRAPSAVERGINRVFGFVLGLGVGPQYNQLLEVRGRKSGKLYSTPVNVMEHDARRWIVCPRGRAQWVLNAEATGGRVTLRRGKQVTEYQLRALPIADRPPLLREYLRRYVGVVQRYFTVEAGAELLAFAQIAQHHPVFELLELPAS